MINKILLLTYKYIPIGFRNYVGRSRVVKPIRDLFLRPNGHFREMKVRVVRNYHNFPVEFDFYASVKVAAKAERRGIENTILRHSIKLLSNRNSENDLVILDVGANFGYLSLVWASTILKNGNIHAFEPNRQVYNSFQKSINENKLDKSIHLNNLAVGKKDGFVNLYSSSTSSNTLNISESIGPESSIRMISLDSYVEKNEIESCDLIKIDVDGIEYEILKGAENLLKKFRPIFIVETNGDERLIEFFSSHNYQILDMKLEPYILGDMIPGNIFCVPDN